MTELTVGDVQRQTCATTQEVGADKCKLCGDPIPVGKRKDAEFCSRACQMHAARDMQNELISELRDVAKSIAYRYLNRDRYLGFDGKYEGPLNKSVTVVVSIKKDRGYHPMPIDVHVEPAKAKFTQVTPDDVDWGKRQGRHGNTSMGRGHNHYCANCIDMVIDGASNKVRITKGVYLPIEHECNSVRVYDLQGKLIEVKGI